MEVSDAEIADHVLALYDYNNGPKVHWTCLQHSTANDGITWGLARVGGYDLIVFRGTTTIGDAIRDLIAVAIPFGHPELGPVHAGFWFGMPQVFDNIKPFIKNPVIVAGHSLGGARAAIYAGLLVVSGMAPAYLCTFGGPRAGFIDFAKKISGVRKCLYVNRHDIIPDLPLHLLIEDYMDSGPRTYISEEPSFTQLNWGPFAWHHMELYRRGMK